MSPTAGSDPPDAARRGLLGKLLVLGVAARFRAGRAAGTKQPLSLTASQRSTLEVCADVLVPGAAAAGVVEFVVTMLARADPWLCYRFVSVPIPILQFYQSALNEIDRCCRQSLHHRLGELSQRAQSDFIADLARGQLNDWRGPPQPLVYFIFRNDALDAFYGQVASYQRLQVPYMAHITPPRGWPSV
jgi:hypothetical protein